MRKEMMRRMFVIVILLFCRFYFGNAQSIGIRAGSSLFPATHFGLTYEHWTNGGINFTLAGFMERSRKNLLNYSCYGADLLGEYSNSSPGDESLVNLRFGLGATWQVENEPWLYKGLSFSQRMNYGIAGEAAIECHLTENFRLQLFGQQKYLLRHFSSQLRSCFGLGLYYQLSSY